MSIQCDVPTIGIQDTVIGGVPFALPITLDTRAALVRNGKTFMPSGLLGWMWSQMEGCVVEGLDVVDGCKMVARYLSMAGQICLAGASTQYRNLDDQLVRRLAEAAGFTLSDGEVPVVLDVIALAQMGDKFVQQWTTAMLSESPLYEAMLHGLTLTRINNEASEIASWTQVVVFSGLLALWTRLPQVAEKFSSKTEVMDMERRASVCDRLSAYPALLAASARAAKIAMARAIIDLPLFSRVRALAVSESQYKELLSRVDAFLSLLPDMYKMYLADALQTTASHMGRECAVFRLPQGIWHERILNVVAPATAAKLTATTLGQHMTVADIHADTTVAPTLNTLQEISASTFESAVESLFNHLRVMLENEVALAITYDQDMHVAYALRDAHLNSQRISEARDALTPAGLVAMDITPAADPIKLTPTVYDVQTADDAISTVGDLLQSALLPAHYGHHDVRDLARFRKGRALTLRDRLVGHLQDDEPHNTTETPGIVVFLPYTAIGAQKPLLSIAMPIFELYPSPFLGSAENGLVRPATGDGLADLLEHSESRMAEMFESLLNGPEGQAFASTLAYAWAYIGHVYHVKNGTVRKLDAWLSDLRKKGFVTAPNCDGAFAGLADSIAWNGALTPSVKAQRFTTLSQFIQLDKAGRWVFAPYSWIAMPTDLTRETIESALMSIALSPVPAVAPDTMRRRWRRVFKAEAQLLPCAGIGRIPGKDSRTTIPFSYPAARYGGSPISLALKSYTAGEATRYQPVRLDADDVLLWTTEELIGARSTVDLDCRPGKRFVSMPEALVDDFALAGEDAVVL